MVAFMTLVLVLLPQRVCKLPLRKCGVCEPLPIDHQYYQPGDFIIGSIIAQNYLFLNLIAFEKCPSPELIDDLVVMTQLYQQIMALVFAVGELNENPQILPNITLGFNIYNSLLSAVWIYHASLELLSTRGGFILNYKCDIQNYPEAIIGGPNSELHRHMATILSIYKIPQFIYGSAPVMDHQTEAAFFHRLFPNGALQYRGILHLLLHFRWIWIGVIYLDDDLGEKFIQDVLPRFSQSGICFEFVERFPSESFSNNIAEQADDLLGLYNIVMGSTANVVVIHGEIQTTIILRVMLEFPAFEDVPMKRKSKVWIMTAQMELMSLPIQRSWDIHFIHGALSFAIHSKQVTGFSTFLHNRKPALDKGDGFIRVFWEQAFNCVFPNSKVDEEICTGEEKLETLPGSVFEMSMTSHSYSIYNAVCSVAHALHAVQSSKFKHREMTNEKRWNLKNHQPWQLHDFLRSFSFNNSAGEKVSFDQDGNLVAGFDIINWVTFRNQSFRRVKVGRIEPRASEDILLSVDDDAIVWPSRFNQAQPLSLCNENCHPGYRRTKKEDKPFCCYDCLPCPEGKISNEKDTDHCFQCPEDHYPNNEKDLCIPKYIVYMSYGEPLGMSLAIFVLIFSFVTAVVLGIFIKHKDTPIVKANNRNLTYTLLISLLLCFLCALLFIGKPEMVSCLLQQTAFGVIFSVAVSCILAKTMIVVLAFMATKPGSKMKKWVRKPLACYVVFTCFLLQAILCTVWLASYPPFPSLDMNSLNAEMVLKCNEGSTLMFYCVLGFLGFLALISFSVAFLARKLPDTFNEAKFITFSMLIFCSVWLSFIPAYLSTKGKYMVAAEIFSILASSAGLLVCIFSPKCYTIVVRPDLNRREQLRRTFK
ncbi:vomeronasal type-2 receptor 26-like [Tiliqua scincoides]|uniref:vomeronasal type-2 receptor 26-like n=1 Tax=Tiliqua scincoides TaxID=71010 RepID=UPI0034624660